MYYIWTFLKWFLIYEMTRKFSTCTETFNLYIYLSSYKLISLNIRGSVFWPYRTWGFIKLIIPSIGKSIFLRPNSTPHNILYVFYIGLLWLSVTKFIPLQSYSKPKIFQVRVPISLISSSIVWKGQFSVHHLQNIKNPVNRRQRCWVETWSNFYRYLLYICFTRTQGSLT